MKKMTSETLENSGFTVPYAAPSPLGVAWLRGEAVRFSEGENHRRRRLLTERLLAQLTVAPADGEDPATAVLTAMGMPTVLAEDVALAASGYQPHFPQSAAADEAVERLVAAFGVRDEVTAANICILVQSQAGAGALIQALREKNDGPPLLSTRRVDAAGTEVEVELHGAHFGRGHHACPGEHMGRILAAAAIR